MKKQLMIVPFCCAFLLAGCSTTSDSNEDSEQDWEGRPDQSQRSIRFPNYLLMDGVQLNDHGRIPNTSLIGAEMTTKLDLIVVRSRFGDVLNSEGWHTDRMEIGKQSFRLMATHGGEAVEIRAVQGTGPTQIFLLYTPATEADKALLQE